MTVHDAEILKAKWTSQYSHLFADREQDKNWKTKPSPVEANRSSHMKKLTPPWLPLPDFHAWLIAFM